MPRRNFRELEARMSPDQLQESDTRVRKMIEEMPFSRLRSAQSLTQEHLAAILGKDQSAISQLERRTDMYIRTLADFIKALGGELEIRANFPDGSVRITGLTGLTEKTSAAGMQI